MVNNSIMFLTYNLNVRIIKSLVLKHILRFNTKGLIKEEGITYYEFFSNFQGILNLGYNSIAYYEKIEIK